MYVLSNNLTMKIGTKREGGCTCRNFSDFSSTSTEYIDFHFCVMLLIVPSIAPPYFNLLLVSRAILRRTQIPNNNNN